LTPPLFPTTFQSTRASCVKHLPLHYKNSRGVFIKVTGYWGSLIVTFITVHRKCRTNLSFLPTHFSHWFLRLYWCSPSSSNLSLSKAGSF
jgi:hypothetical protein